MYGGSDSIARPILHRRIERADTTAYLSRGPDSLAANDAPAKMTGHGPGAAAGSRATEGNRGLARVRLRVTDF